MFLRSLAVRGFKSFADRTVIEFAPGVSVIVGPNGSGKSNLVDAIAWVLGEQGPRALRGSQMADVIFAGSPARPALGLAEVGLVIDNEAGLIPVAQSEIEVGRVVYRSGDSQYLIGGRSSRLLDIQELLSDSGIGRALHTVVGQGQLEDVLVAGPEERRQFIEEAAGIAKHRRRKERAQRRLVSLDQDLLRLQDVMAELKRRLRPLKQQAEAAGKHERLSGEADDLAWRLAAARLRDLLRDRDARRPGWEEGQARRREAQEKLATLDAEIASLASRLGEAERVLARAETRETEAGQARSAAEVALRESVRNEGEARARAAEASGRSGRLGAIEEEVDRAERDLSEVARDLSEKEAALGAAERAYAEAERTRRVAEEQRRLAQERAVDHRVEVQALRRSLEVAQTEQHRIAASLAEVRRREADTQRRRDELEEEVERLDGRYTPVSDRLSRLQREADRLGAEVVELEGRERALDGRRQAVGARREALADTPGRRMLRSRRGRVIGLLSELIEVEKGMERAVAASLGGMADAVVYADHGEAVADAPEAGGATMAVAQEAPPSFVLPRERSLLSAVKASDPRAEAAVRNALRHVYLAEDRDDALARHRNHPGAAFVTPDGVLVGPAVVRTAPHPSDADRALRQVEDAALREYAEVGRDLTARRQALARLNAERASVEEALRRTDADITATAERMARLDADLAAVRREREVLEQRAAGVEGTLAEVTAAIGAAPAPDGPAQGVPPVPEPPVELRVTVEALRRERTRLEEGVAARRADAERFRREDPTSLAEMAQQATDERERAELLQRETETAAADAATRREAAARGASDLRSQDTRANREWREAAATLQGLRDEYEDAEQSRREVERRIAEAERVLADGHRKDPAEAVQALGDDDTVEELQKRSDLLARRLALLGRVNLVAGEEYRELQERHDFLQREIDDVKAARRDLQQVIGDVDRQVVEIFDAAFRDVAAQFQELFAQLFPDGEGKLSLTDPGDLLTTGIEIEARPGRKRVKRLSLLSGGERALTALGFLFAIFRARPSPFYLLDEVEAALDDVNLHRFLELIRGFAEMSQVILVTHQKRTMEAADILYGVSMGKDGASRVISQRVADAVGTR
jgi:chromosome segregation protein